jgi:hypothetical protein
VATTLVMMTVADALMVSVHPSIEYTFESRPLSCAENAVQCVLSKHRHSRLVQNPLVLVLVYAVPEAYP